MQRGQIHVVVMIVTEEHGVNARQILPQYARLSSTPRPYPGKRARSFRPNGVRQNIGTALLQEHRRMIHQRDAQSVSVHARRRCGWLNIRNETWRRFGPAGQFPPQSINKPRRLRSIRIVESLPIKVLWKHAEAYCALPTAAGLQVCAAGSRSV